MANFLFLISGLNKVRIVYKKSLEEIEAHRPAHWDFLKTDSDSKRRETQKKPFFLPFFDLSGWPVKVF